MKTPTKTIAIHTYQPRFQQAFKALNEEWINTYFQLEESDLDVLNDPENYILAKGGQIFCAEEDTEVLGVCALVHTKETNFDFELAKMAVSPKAQGKGIGYQLLEFALQWARKHGAKNIYLVSNTKLESAIHLYRKFGFEETNAIQSPYERTNINMAITL